MPTYKALFVTQDAPASIQHFAADAFPSGEVLIRIAYSSLNYKDGLAVTGKPGVIRKYPMVPGIDLAGTVEESASPEFKPGDEVVVTGCGTSETMWGGYAQMCRLNAEYIVPLPKGLTLKQAMGVGTAGFTAMQCIMALEQHGLKPGGPQSNKDVVVTGAAGGVGSVAVAILARLGYKVVASSGRPELTDYLKSLGAAEILDRSVLSAPSKRPMESERWGGAVDTVGGDTLAGVIRTLAASCSVAACGLAGGGQLNTTVYPFILRGVNLLGINSVNVPNARRRAIWNRIVQDLPLALLDSMIEVHPLEQFSELGEAILAGRTRGRVVIDVNL
ncbi:MAG TPA: MDR family oxidoreductase [Bryobacteraceae bacterium]|nr:MDR family oxidoreductase [Bryobacteraceae bacterium]